MGLSTVWAQGNKFQYQTVEEGIKTQTSKTLKRHGGRKWQRLKTNGKQKNSCVYPLMVSCGRWRVSDCLLFFLFLTLIILLLAVASSITGYLGLPYATVLNPSFLLPPGFFIEFFSVCLLSHQILFSSITKNGTLLTTLGFKMWVDTLTLFTVCVVIRIYAA